MIVIALHFATKIHFVVWSAEFRRHTYSIIYWGEFSGHEEIARALACKTYFSEFYHLWQRGLSEITNGLLRRFFHKGVKIVKLSKKEIEAAD